ncbi:uncharacterized protein TNCV_4671741 [Trichonephila clavipes]|nr:uncharacterized protein TNCV_4671741 [Trichonephila clavipes]
MPPSWAYKLKRDSAEKTTLWQSACQALRRRRIDEADISTLVAVDQHATNCLEEAVRSFTVTRSRCRSSRADVTIRRPCQFFEFGARRFTASKLASLCGTVSLHRSSYCVIGKSSFLKVDDPPPFKFHIPRGKKSGIDKSWEHGGQRPLEMTRSSKNSVKLPYCPTDSLFIGLLRKAVSTSATFVFTMEALPDFFLSATDTVSRNYCTIVDAFGAVSPGYFY